jgi:hypothetical protein
MTQTRRETEVEQAQAAALGQALAEDRANALRHAVPAADWPDFWEDAQDVQWPVELRGARRLAFEAAAERAAQDRWRELLSEQRAVEDIEEDPHEPTADAAQLEAALRESVPQGTICGRDGSRVYLLDTETGMECTVTSLEGAWRVIEEWGERRRPGM